MRKETEDHAKRSRRIAYLAIAMLLITSVATSINIIKKEAAHTANAKLQKHPEYPSTPKVKPSPPDNRRARGVLVTRAATGQLPAPAAYNSWGFVVAEDIIGAPQPGDLAYLARLGPDHGLMKVEAVEANRIVLTMDTLDQSQIFEGDRIETMPPLPPARHE